MTDIEYELYHHGVKGMKWGVRKKGIVADNPTKRYPIGTKGGPEPIKHRPIGTKTSTSTKKSKSAISEYQKERNRQNKHIATKRAIDIGSRFINEYTNRHNTTINGARVGVPNGVKAIVNRLLDYKYMKDTFK